jgi:hypothetical protein
MSATTTPTLLNLPPLPKPRTVNELANSINYTYSEINRAFNIISRAFKFDKTITTGNTTVTGTQIGGFLITANSLVSTNTTDNLQIGLYSSKPGGPSFALITGDLAASGTKVTTIGNGVTFGFLIQINNQSVAELRRTASNHGYLLVTKSDYTTVFVADGNANACTVGGTLTMSGTGATDGLYARTASNTKLYIGSGTDTVVRLGGTSNHRAELAILTGNYGVITRNASSLVITSLTHNSGTSVGALYVGDATGVNYVTASGLGDVAMTRNLSVGGVTTLSSTQIGANLTVTGSITTALLQFSAGGSLYFPGAFIPTAPVATGYLVARDNGGNFYKLLCAP